MIEWKSGYKIEINFMTEVARLVGKLQPEKTVFSNFFITCKLLETVFSKCVHTKDWKSGLK